MAYRLLVTTIATALSFAGSAIAQEPPADRERIGYDKGFFLRSADGANELKINALLQTHGIARQGGMGQGAMARTSEFDLRRMRFEISGKLDEHYRFRIEPNFSDKGVELAEAWIGTQAGSGDERLRVMFGRMKEPFSFEEMSSLKNLEFVEKSILTNFVPKEDHGITILGNSNKGRLEWGAAIYNGTAGNELNDDKDIAGRLVWKPWHAEENHPLQGLQFGGAFTWGDTDQDLEGRTLRTEARVPFVIFESGSALDGGRQRYALEAAWLDGPRALYGEFIRVAQDASGTTGSGEVTIDAWYLAGSWVLSGEDGATHGVHPEHPVVGGSNGGGGAWQLAARVSRMDLDSALIDLGLVAPASDPGNVTSFDFGVNWYLSYQIRTKLHFLHTRYGQSISSGGSARSSENALLLQFQINF